MRTKVIATAASSLAASISAVSSIRVMVLLPHRTPAT
jgi:hypothetical protein